MKINLLSVGHHFKDKLVELKISAISEGLSHSRDSNFLNLLTLTINLS